MQNLAVASIFVLTWLMIASRRLEWLPLGRPAGALLGAVSMVAVSALTPKEAFEAVNNDTISLLLGMMLLTSYLARGNAFEWIAQKALRLARSGTGLLVLIALTAAALSAFLVNDAACLFLTPVVVATCRRAQLPMGPFLIALATSANIGSAATTVGNPQNMLIGSVSGIRFARYAAASAPVAAICVALNVTLLLIYYKKSLSRPLLTAADPSPPTVATAPLVATGLLIVGFFSGFHLGFSALAAVVALMLFDRREPRDAFDDVDWTLLLFFAALFVVVAGVRTTGWVDQAWIWLFPSFQLDHASDAALFTGFVATGSNIVSNVPLVLLVSPYLRAANDDTAWLVLGFASTIAGNLTLVGSVANLIVAEGAKDDYPLGFMEYLRFGVPSTLLALAVGVPLLLMGA